MTQKPQRELIQQLHQAVVGIPENPDDNGLIGKVEDIRVTLIKQNTRVRKNEQRINKIWGILIGVGALGGGGLGVGLSNLLGG